MKQNHESQQQQNNMKIINSGWVNIVKWILNTYACKHVPSVWCIEVLSVTPARICACNTITSKYRST